MEFIMFNISKVIGYVSDYWTQDSVDAKKREEIPRKIQIISHVNLGGLGDIMCGLKLGHFLTEKFSNIKISLCVDEKYVETCKELAGNRFKVHKIKSMPEKDNEKPKLRIHCPASGHTLP